MKIFRESFLSLIKMYLGLFSSEEFRKKKPFPEMKSVPGTRSFLVTTGTGFPDVISCSI